MTDLEIKMQVFEKRFPFSDQLQALNWVRKSKSIDETEKKMWCLKFKDYMEAYKFIESP